MLPGFRTFAACVLLLVLKMFVVAFLTPVARARATVGFTVVRVLHTLCYLRRWSALRTTAWMLGALSTLVLGGFTAGALAAK